VTPAVADIDDGSWHRWRLRRVIRRNGSFLTAWIGGEKIFDEVSVAAFSTTTVKRFSFGYVNNGNSQNWTVNWDRVHIVNQCERNYYNLRRDDGALAGGASVQMTSALGLFLAGDDGKRIRLYADNESSPFQIGGSISWTSERRSS
jgi:hypothetical protein